jgi:hypothetical protein
LSLLADRFQVEGTGGGCEALILRHSQGVILVTDGNLGVDFDDLADDCQVEVGWYPDEDAPYEGRCDHQESFDSLDEAMAAVAVRFEAEGFCPKCLVPMAPVLTSIKCPACGAGQEEKS